MAKAFTVSLQNIIKETALETIYMPVDPAACLVASCDVNRPGLALGGYFDYFDSDRVQILGKSEHGYLEDLPAETRAARIDEFVSQQPPAIVMSRGLEVLGELQASCEKYKVPLLTIPVKPGRNLAIIIEVAAMNNRQKKMGYNAAQELMRNLGMSDAISSSEVKIDWNKF